MNYWIIAGVVASHVFVFFLGNVNGRKKAIDEMLSRQMQMDATRLWTDSLKKYMGGKNE